MYKYRFKITAEPLLCGKQRLLLTNTIRLSTVLRQSSIVIKQTV